jgi:hypothetical protein
MVIRCRDQLLDWITEHSPTRAIRRALAEGTVEVLGGFSTDPPCWIVRVTSTCNKMWNVTVTGEGKIGMLISVPWELWGEGSSPLCRGDDPKCYAHWKELYA